MNIDIYGNPYTLESLQKDFEDAPLMNELQELRFIFINGEDLGFNWVEILYEHNNKYYLIKDAPCSCRLLSWDPEEVTIEYIKDQYPDIDITTDLFKSQHE